MERRSLQIKELEIRSAEDGSDTLTGYASVFDSWSDELGGIEPFREKVVKGAFAETIEKDDIRCLFNHDPNYVLGRNRSGTLTLEEDEKGLKVTIKPPKTAWAKDLIVSVKRGDISQMSFGFSCELDRWSYEGKVDVRELIKVKLYDVSLVTYPAYPATECDVRSIIATRQAERQKQEAEKQKQQAEEAQKKQLLQQQFMEEFELNDD